MKYLSNYSTIVAELIIHELIAQDIKTFVVSPGKRDIPLLNAISRNSKNTEIIEAIDERSAGFMALGLGHTKPVALVCTSGTALTHYAPAVEEAKKSGQKILILSADRPLNLIHSNANQTLQQYNYYKLNDTNFIQLETPSASLPVHSIVRRVAHLAHQVNTGLVCHLNTPLIEPLDYTPCVIDKEWKSKARKVLSDNSPYTLYKQTASLPLKELLSKESALVIGEIHDRAFQNQVNRVIKTSNQHLFADITSGCLLSHNSFHPDQKKFEKLLKEKKIKKIIHIGKRVTSNKYYQLLQKYNISIIHLDQNSDQLNDPSFQVREFIKVQKIKGTSQRRKKAPYHFPILPNKLHHYSAAQILWDNIHLQETLLLGNSMVIRSFDHIAKKERKAETYFQRGISGIDGNIAHAIGLAHSGKRVSVILGDIAMLHDIGSLLTCATRTLHLNIYIFNSNSGEIFNLLNSDTTKKTKQIITSKHQINFEKVTQAMGVNYFKINSCKQLQEVCHLQRTGVSIVEIVVDTQHTKDIFRRFIQE